MRKILYVLCLLTTLVACSDDDDKIITDYDKPYSKLPTSELRTLIEDNINSCITLVEEFAEMEENNSILDIMNYYGINFYFDISDFMNSRSSDQSKENRISTPRSMQPDSWKPFFPLPRRISPIMIFISLQRLIIVPGFTLK